jgi:uncharacterized protein (DUF488 family)
MNDIYTFGYSTHTFIELVNSIKNNNIDVAVDVRSVPYSKYTPQFNKESVKEGLLKEKIHYLHFGDEFGARRIEKEAYTNGKVDFQKVIKLPKFLKGIERINNGLEKNYHIVLLCTEKEPIDCHRFLLVSKVLKDLLHINIHHILFDGNIIEQNEVELKMIKQLNLHNSLFENNKDNLEKAYKIFGNKIVYQEMEIDNE